jgi:ethanolamine utilization protein EutA
VRKGHTLLANLVAPARCRWRSRLQLQAAAAEGKGAAIDWFVLQPAIAQLHAVAVHRADLAPARGGAAVRFLPRRGPGAPRARNFVPVQPQGASPFGDMPIKYIDPPRRSTSRTNGSRPTRTIFIKRANDPLAHDGDGDHVHEMSAGQRGELVEYIWKVENVELTTVGIDIGSSTSHLMFASVRLQRKTQALSSAFVVVERRILWKSPILLTPSFPTAASTPRGSAGFVASCHEDAGLAPGEIDTGAVILTGEAIKRSNARALANLFAADSGKFVCASAGHHLECVLAAHGSGAVALSRETPKPSSTSTSAAAPPSWRWSRRRGGLHLRRSPWAGASLRCRAHAHRRIARSRERGRLRSRPRRSAVGACARRRIAHARPARGASVTDLDARDRASLLRRRRGIHLRPRGARFRRHRRPLAAHPRGLRAGASGIADVEPREGIRATVIGASQFTVQVSGKTIHVARRPPAAAQRPGAAPRVGRGHRRRRVRARHRRGRFALAGRGRRNGRAQRSAGAATRTIDACARWPRRSPWLSWLAPPTLRLSC